MNSGPKKIKHNDDEKDINPRPIKKAKKESTAAPCKAHNKRKSSQCIIENQSSETKPKNLDKDLNAALLHAATQGNGKKIVKLLNLGAKWDCTNERGNTPLHIAAIKGHELAIQLLLENGADVEAKNNNQSTPLHCAAEAGHQLCTKTLIDWKANVHAKNNLGGTALHLAAVNDHSHIILFLLVNNASIDDTDILGNTPLHYAAMENKTSALQSLLESGANISLCNEEGNKALHCASRNGHVESILILLKSKVSIEEPNDEGCTPLILASLGGGSTELAIQTLIDQGADVNAKNKFNTTALHFAARRKKSSNCQILLTNGANTQFHDSQGKTPLHIAAETGCIDIVQLLLQYNADIHAIDQVGDTPLHSAAIFGHVPIIELLLSKGAHSEIKNKQGETPLYYAASYGYKMALQRLCEEENADINIMNFKGDTPLHQAVLKSHIAIIKILLNKNACSNIHNSKNLTPLHLAALKGNLDVIQLIARENSSENRFGLYVPKNQIKGPFEILQVQNPTLLHFDLKRNRLEGLLVDRRNEQLRTNGKIAYHISSYCPQHDFKRVIRLDDDGTPSYMDMDEKTIFITKEGYKYVIYWLAESNLNKRELHADNEFVKSLPKPGEESYSSELINNILLAAGYSLDELQTKKNDLNKSDPAQSEELCNLNSQIGIGLYYRLPHEIRSKIKDYIFNSEPLTYTQAEDEKTKRIAGMYSSLEKNRRF